MEFTFHFLQDSYIIFVSRGVPARPNCECSFTVNGPRFPPPLEMKGSFRRVTEKTNRLVQLEENVTELRFTSGGAGGGAGGGGEGRRTTHRMERP